LKRSVVKSYLFLLTFNSLYRILILLECAPLRRIDAWEVLGFLPDLSKLTKARRN